MNINQLVPAYMCAQNFGVKAMVHGKPGVGKTPVVDTAPRPVLLACEPGLLSMAKSQTPVWEAYTPPRVWEFFDWLFGSHEAKAFDTVAVDSVSQVAEMVLAQQMSMHKDPRKAYGEMARQVYDRLSGLYFLPQKHVYLIAKQMAKEEGPSKTLFARPYFPGQELHVKVPHLFDLIIHMEKMLNPGDGKYHPVFRTLGTDNVLARDRSGKLAEVELAHLGNMFTKAMA